MPLKTLILLIGYIRIFSKNLKLEKLTNIYEIFEKPLIKILAFMEIEGIKIDNKFLKYCQKNLRKKLIN